MNVWCGECYAESPGDPFPHQGLPEEDDGLELESKEMEDYRKGRDGDHLMAVPFECDLCHYRNLRKRDPDLSDHRDVYLLTCIRRAVLDACWARRPKTVSSNLARHIRDYDTVRTFGLRGEDCLPKLGWPVLQDRVGMALAVQAVHISRRPGRHAEHIQFSTVRKTHSWYTNAYTAGMEYNTAAMFVKDEKKTYVTTSPANGEWFTRFKRGMAWVFYVPCWSISSNWSRIFQYKSHKTMKLSPLNLVSQDATETTPFSQKTCFTLSPLSRLDWNISHLLSPVLENKL